MILLQQFYLVIMLTLAPLITSHQPLFPSPSRTIPRGGSEEPIASSSEEERNAILQSYNKLLKYRSDQQLLYQLRSTYLSELLASRGVPLPTVVGVSTVEGEKPAERVDWDCALSTVEDPKVNRSSLIWVLPHLSCALLNKCIFITWTYSYRHVSTPSTPNPTPKS
jgi:hypothetical protein